MQQNLWIISFLCFFVKSSTLSMKPSCWCVLRKHPRKNFLTKQTLVILALTDFYLFSTKVLEPSNGASSNKSCSALLWANLQVEGSCGKNIRVISSKKGLPLFPSNLRNILARHQAKEYEFKTLIQTSTTEWIKLQKLRKTSLEYQVMHCTQIGWLAITKFYLSLFLFRLFVWGL